MQESTVNDPFVHAGSAHLCPSCGAPDSLGIGCFCTDDLGAGLSCSTCGASPDDYEATCPECRAIGRVDMSLVSFLERTIAGFDCSVQLPPKSTRDLLPEEPLPTVEPPKRSSWRPRAA